MIAWSLPITWAATCVTTSGMTGLTLPGMIELPFWSSGRKISRRPARGPEPISRRSFAIFVSETATTLSAPEASTSPSRAACASNGSAGGRDLEAGLVGEQRAHALGELGVRVQAGADRGAAERDLAEALQRGLDALDPLAHLRRVAAELLAERHRHGVHQVRPARLDDVVELARLRLERARRAGRAPAAGRASSSPSAARCTADGKTSFDDWPMLTSSFACTSVAGERRDHLVRVHVRATCPSRSGRRRSGTGRRARRAAIAVAGRGDALRLLRVEQPELGVRARGRCLDPSEPAGDRGRDRLARRRGSWRSPSASRRPRARAAPRCSLTPASLAAAKEEPGRRYRARRGRGVPVPIHRAFDRCDHGHCLAVPAVRPHSVARALQV